MFTRWAGRYSSLSVVAGVEIACNFLVVIFKILSLIAGPTHMFNESVITLWSVTYIFFLLELNVLRNDDFSEDICSKFDEKLLDS